MQLDLLDTITSVYVDGLHITMIHLLQYTLAPAFVSRKPSLNTRVADIDAVEFPANKDITGDGYAEGRPGSRMSRYVMSECHKSD